MARLARDIWRDLSSRLPLGLVHRHVPSHSNHKWNDLVDLLAKDGASGRVGPQDGPWSCLPPLPPTTACPGVWVALCTRRAIVYATDVTLVVTLRLTLDSIRYIPDGRSFPYQDYSTTPSLFSLLTSFHRHRPPAPGFVACSRPLLLIPRESRAMCDYTTHETATDLIDNSTTTHYISLAISGLPLRQALRPVVRILNMCFVDLRARARSITPPPRDVTPPPPTPCCSSSLCDSDTASTSGSASEVPPDTLYPDGCYTGYFAGYWSYAECIRQGPKPPPEGAIPAAEAMLRERGAAPPPPTPHCTPVTPAYHSDTDSDTRSATSDALSAASADDAPITPSSDFDGDFDYSALEDWDDFEDDLSTDQHAHEPSPPPHDPDSPSYRLEHRLDPNRMLDIVNRYLERFPGDNPTNDYYVMQGWACVAGWDARGAEILAYCPPPNIPHPLALTPSSPPPCATRPPPFPSLQPSTPAPPPPPPSPALNALPRAPTPPPLASPPPPAAASQSTSLFSSARLFLSRVGSFLSFHTPRPFHGRGWRHAWVTPSSSPPH